MPLWEPGGSVLKPVCAWLVPCEATCNSWWTPSSMFTVAQHKRVMSGVRPFPLSRWWSCPDRPMNGMFIRTPLRWFAAWGDVVCLDVRCIKEVFLKEMMWWLITCVVGVQQIDVTEKKAVETNMIRNFLRTNCVRLVFFHVFTEHSYSYGMMKPWHLIQLVFVSNRASCSATKELFWTASPMIKGGGGMPMLILGLSQSTPWGNWCL